MKLTSPAPKAGGETLIALSLISTVTSSGTGGAGSFLKSLRPQPAERDQRNDGE